MAWVLGEETRQPTRRCWVLWVGSPAGYQSGWFGWLAVQVRAVGGTGLDRWVRFSGGLDTPN